MVNRINLILQAKNITARQFAEEIGIQPSGMSHILSGRNNPSLDFVMKVIRRYPEIDINWLMFGKGEMYETGKGGLHPSPMSDSRSAAVSQQSLEQTAQGQQSMFSSPEPDLFSGVPQPHDNRPQQPAILTNPIHATLVEEQKPIDSFVVKESVPQNSPAGFQSTKQAELPTMKVPEPRVESSVPIVEKEAVSQSEPSISVFAPKGKRIVRLLAFYDDRTFGEYFPE